MWIGVLWGWSAGRHVDHPCGGPISPWPAREVTEVNGALHTSLQCVLALEVKMLR